MEKATRVLIANRPKVMREVVVATFVNQPDIEIVGEVSEECDILDQVQATHPDLLVVALDESERRPTICDRLLREYPALRILAVAFRKDRTICYWASFAIHSNDVEPSADGLLRTVRNMPNYCGKPS